MARREKVIRANPKANELMALASGPRRVSRSRARNSHVHVGNDVGVNAPHLS